MSENCGGTMVDPKTTPFRAALDSCYIIDWLEDKPERKKEADLVEELMGMAFRGEVALAISVAVVSEVFPAKHGGQERYSSLRRLYAHPAFNVLPVDIAIAEKAAYLREGLNVTGAKRALDVIHLSTAIRWCARYFYTRDGQILNLNERLAALPEHGPVGRFEICEIHRTRLRDV